MTDRFNRISDEVARKATGRDWYGWLSILDKEATRKMSHTEIARLMQEKGNIESAWWWQTVAGGYELSRGLRAVGETLAPASKSGSKRALKFQQKNLGGLFLRPMA